MNTNTYEQKNTENGRQNTGYRIHDLRFFPYILCSFVANNKEFLKW